MLHLPLYRLIHTPPIRILRINEPRIPNPHLPPLPIIDLKNNRHIPKIIIIHRKLFQPRQRRYQNPPREDPFIRRHPHLDIGRRRRHVPIEAGRHIPIVGALNGPIAVLREIGFCHDGRLAESAADVAVGEGRGLEAAGVEEQVGSCAGHAPEVFEPGLVGAGFREDFGEGKGHVGVVEEAVRGSFGSDARDWIGI